MAAWLLRQSGLQNTEHRSDGGGGSALHSGLCEQRGLFPHPCHLPDRADAKSVRRSSLPFRRAIADWSAGQIHVGGIYNLARGPASERLCLRSLRQVPSPWSDPYVNHGLPSFPRPKKIHPWQRNQHDLIGDIEAGRNLSGQVTAVDAGVGRILKTRTGTAGAFSGRRNPSIDLTPPSRTVRPSGSVAGRSALILASAATSSRWPAQTPCGLRFVGSFPDTTWPSSLLRIQTTPVLFRPATKSWPN